MQCHADNRKALFENRIYGAGVELEMKISERENVNHL